MPTIQFICGGEIVNVDLVPTEPPAALLASHEERRALDELHALLYGEWLGLAGFETNTRAGAADGVSLPLPCALPSYSEWPRRSTERSPTAWISRRSSAGA